MNSIPQDLQAGATGRAYAALGISTASASAPVRVHYHRVGFRGSPHPARAQSSDPSLRRRSAELELFVPKGRHKARQPAGSAMAPTRDAATGRVAWQDVDAVGDVFSPHAICRHLGLVAELRLSWMMSIAEQTHPHFLPLHLLMAAREYCQYIAFLELEYNHEGIVELDAALMEDRYSGMWDFDQPIDSVLLTALSAHRRGTAARQCLLCGQGGHCLNNCSKVTGRAGQKGAAISAAADGDGGARGAALQLCRRFNSGNCGFRNCKFSHTCSKCAKLGAHGQKHAAKDCTRTAGSQEAPPRE
eukprot:SAG11_NODE_2514_length_3266_cov_6.464162_3_plen_302_part_00